MGGDKVASLAHRRFAVWPWIILAFWAVWALAVVLHGMGWHLWFWPASPPDFTQSGAFGDSFGALASLMAALAAAGALFTLRHQREEGARQSFEGSFFTLLKNLQDVVNSTDIQVVEFDEGGKTASENVSKVLFSAQGNDAFREMLSTLRETLQTSDFEDEKEIKRKYEHFHNRWQDDLGHYFRIMYHIFRLIEERCIGDKRFYARIVRAHLSHSQTVLLAYNCWVGDGREKFLAYVESYALLHNMGKAGNELESLERKFFEDSYGVSAFGARKPEDSELGASK